MRALLLTLTLLAGCQSLADDVVQFRHDGDDAANYRRIFDCELPSDMTIANSIVVSYDSDASEDFEFEFYAPRPRVRELEERFFLRRWDQSDVDIQSRLSRALRAWYEPEPLSEFETYRDITSVGYVHMHVRAQSDPDGRHQVFISKH